MLLRQPDLPETPRLSVSSGPESWSWVVTQVLSLSVFENCFHFLTLRFVRLLNYFFHLQLCFLYICETKLLSINVFILYHRLLCFSLEERCVDTHQVYFVSTYCYGVRCRCRKSLVRAGERSSRRCSVEIHWPNIMRYESHPHVTRTLRCP